MSQPQPDVHVGILLCQPSITVVLDGHYAVTDSQHFISGEQTVSVAPDGERLLWNGKEIAAPLEMRPVDYHTCEAEIKDVIIGVNFHWERRENQRFRGSVRFIIEDGKVTVINVLPVEEYLKSVISSEMSATASAELLKAHAVISRSWLLAQIEKTRNIANQEVKSFNPCTITEGEIHQWFDRDDHVNFDVCADDHCQRYQGITRQTTPTVEDAVNATAGEVLMGDDGHLADARFSKSCGGVFEEFEACWEPVHHSYLIARRDSPRPEDFPNLRMEREAEDWIMSRPEAFCNTSDPEILSQVLNSYDQETKDFYRWTVTYERDELARLIHERSGIDFGYIKDLVPEERGTSGRLIRLRVVGTKRTMIIGKELIIRRYLSKSHLYSSAFVVERQDVDADGVPARIVLHGAGWGHGVGLCQIGAAVMGARGYDYQQILRHYFPGAPLEKLY